MKVIDSDCFGKAFLLTLFIFFAMGASTLVLGQQNEKTIEDRLDAIEGRQEIRPEIKSQHDTTNSPNPVGSGVDLSSLNDNYTLFEFDQSWSSSPNPNPELNFNLPQQGRRAGNVNGDSLNGNPVNDYFVTSKARDEATSDLSDQTWKTAVFYGGNTSGLPDQIIDRKLVPVGDLNGDGYADAFAVSPYIENPSSSDDSRYFYKGSENGYVKTNSTAGLYAEDDIIGFFDFNSDGYGDFLSYNSFSGDVTVVQGAKQFSNINATTQTSVVSSNSPRAVVDDVDQDSVQEIVEFSGNNGDGFITISNIDTTYSYISQQQSFSFTSFSGAASDHELHVINTDSTQYKEILITVKEDTASYLFQYDGQQFNNTATTFNNILIPAGDLNGDGIHDFVEGATNEDPQIFYGTKDLQNFPNQNQPTLSSKSSGAQWTWGMQYNPYSKFGDLTGNGVDDVLMNHLEIINNSFSEGRRVVEPDTTTSPTTLNSNFQLYPRENRLTRIFETQELGDVNADGVEDFAFVYGFQSKVEIYFGGESISSSPDKTISLSFGPDGIASGDYNGDGISDFAISDGSGENLAIFYGGSTISSNPDYSTTASSFQSDGGPGFYHVQSIGDVNGDGSDDLILSSLSEFNGIKNSAVNEAYIFFGGSSIATNPDKTVNLTSQENQIQSGTAMAGLGDVNGDDIDDFAISSAVDTDGEGTGGVVYVYFGGASKSFDSPDLVLESADNGYAYLFGSSIAGGDFTGNGINDIAVSANQFSSDRAVQIFHGGANIDNTVDSLYSRPELGGYENYNAGSNYGHLEVVPDFNNDGKDELLLSSFLYDSYSNAALFTFNNNERKPTAYLKAPNQGAGLGGQHNSAVGDFTGDGQVEVVYTQANDNNDAYQSSRVYRYNLPRPITITKVEDVPDDQGRRIRIHTGGYLMDAMDKSIYGVDNWSVWRMTEDSSWTNLATISPTNNGAGYVDVTVNNTQPTGIDTVDYTYTFRLEAFSSDQGVLARSDTAKGRAYDNIAPPQVQSMEINEQNGDQLVSWQSSEANDVGKYLVYNAKDGNLSDSLVGTSNSTNFTLPESFSGVQNFAVKARDVNNNTGTASPLASAIYPQKVQYDMQSGWNLIGLPVNASADSIQKALGSASYIYKYSGGYTKVDQLKAGVGYWAKFSQTDLCELQGTPVTELSLELNEGWNLISGVGGELPLTLVQDPNEIIVQNTLYNFSQAYIESDTLRPSSGYWLKTSAAGTVTFTHPKLVSDQQQSGNKVNTLAKQTDDVTKNFNTVTISDGEHSRELYFGSSLPKQVNTQQFSLPPLPPGNIFDARFATDTKLIEKAEAKIQLSRIKDTDLTIEVNPQNMAEQSRFLIRELADGKELAEYKVDAGKKITLKHSETNAVFMSAVGNSPLSDNNVPDEFKLEQNYPNPFNPTTQIEYSVTEASKVTLKVYNILGKRVTTLVSKEQQPGNYEVTFDGTNLASGVYLYRLQAGSHVSTKKLILAK